MSSTITSLETITNQNAPGLPEDKFNSLRNLIMDHKADPSNEIFNSQALIAYLPGDASQYEKKIIDTTIILVWPDTEIPTESNGQWSSMDGLNCRRWLVHFLFMAEVDIGRAEKELAEKSDDEHGPTDELFARIAAEKSDDEHGPIDELFAWIAAEDGLSTGGDMDDEDEYRPQKEEFDEEDSSTDIELALVDEEVGPTNSFDSTFDGDKISKTHAAATAAINKIREASENMFDTDDAALAKDAVPGISDIHMAKVFRMVYEHASSDQPTDMETVAMYTPGGMSAHEICVLDTIINSVFGSGLKEVKGESIKEKRDTARNLCNKLYENCYKKLIEKRISSTISTPGPTPPKINPSISDSGKDYDIGDDSEAPIKRTCPRIPLKRPRVAHTESSNYVPDPKFIPGARFKTKLGSGNTSDGEASAPPPKKKAPPGTLSPDKRARILRGTKMDHLRVLKRTKKRETCSSTAANSPLNSFPLLLPTPPRATKPGSPKKHLAPAKVLPLSPPVSRRIFARRFNGAGNATVAAHGVGLEAPSTESYPVLTHDMSLTDIKRKTAEIEFRTAVERNMLAHKNIEVAEMRLKVEEEMLRAARSRDRI